MRKEDIGNKEEKMFIRMENKNKNKKGKKKIDKYRKRKIIK